jgi:hypothetical protein
MERGEFKGRVGRYHWDSEPYWPEESRPRAGAPNVLLVVLDDVGYAQLGCFGSDIETPNLDRLAGNGLRYANFHTTALCSPTRACVLTDPSECHDLAGNVGAIPGLWPPNCTRSSQRTGEQAIETLDGTARDEHRIRAPARAIEGAPTTGVDERQRRCVDDDHARAVQRGRIHRVHHRPGRSGVELALNVHDDDTVRPVDLDL